MLQRDQVEKRIPQDGETFDVIVAGGGPAGIGAAVAASINGAKTLLLENKAFFGGVAAVSGWMPMNRLYSEGKSRGAAVNRFVEKITGFGADAYREGKVSWVDGDGLHIHPDYLRLGVMELLQDIGCYYLLHSPVTGVTMDGNNITSVVCDGKYGRKTYSARVYIDATGDGDLAYHAGVPFHKGRESDGVYMPVTVGFVVSNVDVEKLFAAIDAEGYPAYVGKIYENAKPGEATSVFYSFDKTTVPGTISVNNGGLKDIGIIDATRIEDVNVSLQTGLKVAIDFVKIARRVLPGFENCSLVSTGADLGVRETRRIEGEYTMTLEDAQQGREFDDVVARRYGTIDPGGLKEDKNYHGSIVNGHAYPYRCMLPKTVDPLLVAGRCASLTHLGLTVSKSMGNMMTIGQAAGTAAALCAKDGITPRQIEIAKLQQRLREMGVKL